jgi:hypothetical protein
MEKPVSTTLTELRDRARQRADMVNSAFVTDTELTTYINQGFFELYDLVVASFEDYFTTSTTFTISSGNTTNLPAGFYKLRGVDFQADATTGVYVPLRMYNFLNRNTRNTAPYYMTGGAAREYRIMGDQLLFIPADGATGNYRLWYVPTASELANGTDTIPTSLSKFGWDEYIVLYAAERMLAKEESDTSDIIRQRGEIAARIEKMAANRDIEQVEHVTDTQNGFPWTDYFWRG